jgi:sirohydrochlorin cobaltochelatase
MRAPEFRDSCLVLIGHGSTLNRESSAPTHQHAAALRSRGDFGQVLECFWKEEPSIAGILRASFTPRVFIVPLFISEGYFTDEVIPRELGFPPDSENSFPRIMQKGDQTIHYCRPVGTHPSMTQVLLARGSSVVAENPFPRAPAFSETAIFIAGHGTGSNENSRKAIEDQVGLIRAQNIYMEAHPIFMEEEPRIGDCYDMTSSRNIVIVPFFISDGLHSYEDIPILLGSPKKVVQARLHAGQPTWRNPTERQGKLVWYAKSIGNEPGMVEVIMERVREAAMPEEVEG